MKSGQHLTSSANLFFWLEFAEDLTFREGELDDPKYVWVKMAEFLKHRLLNVHCVTLLIGIFSTLQEVKRWRSTSFLIASCWMDTNKILYVTTAWSQLENLECFEQLHTLGNRTKPYGVHFPDR